ncbi:uncharacterized protein B4U79_08430 [Dinothrombium tinctorium]|uniref:Peptidase M28 domain-containing protein n=1 Tax=Dinothrombium tinctorium TaxID=1965070 RepID=A0A3S3NXV3_9ACAR|nr:uncharacterized protein B4U79_13771 [Dinothrombium tinctorium]RWS03987.1 uncharacterized protein B4U79_04225 [Dinothrombium tinctorium]RWS04049.1 uncharacterized protein B4U79_08430 [Dinothrombium tinctorium]
MTFTTLTDESIAVEKALLYNSFYSSHVEVTIESIKEKLASIFSKQRSTQFDASLKESARKNITHTLAEYGLKIITQAFVIKSISEKPLHGENIIAILPGKQRDTSNDMITVIGAHYDTVKDCPGVDDNGSGVVAILEAAKGALGSLAFVDHYLIAKELIEKRHKFRAAFIADMILNYDKRANTQILPNDVKKMFPNLYDDMKRNQFRGDFLAIWMRKQIDNDSLSYFTNYWKNDYNLVIFDPEIPATNMSAEILHKYRTFLRSDHSSFWFHRNFNYNYPLSAILLTDMGPWRGIQRMCYHDWCDDTKQLTDENLAFIKNTIDTIIEMVVNQF